MILIDGGAVFSAWHYGSHIYFGARWSCCSTSVSSAIRRIQHQNKTEIFSSKNRFEKEQESFVTMKIENLDEDTLLDEVEGAGAQEDSMDSVK